MHSAYTDETKWEKEWGGPIYFAHGEYNARGVATLIPQNLENSWKFVDGIKDRDGRFLMINCKIEENEYTLINLYCPTKDKPVAQNQFLDNIRIKIEENSESNMLIGGDLNTCLLPGADKKGGKIEEISKFSQNIQSLCDE